MLHPMLRYAFALLASASVPCLAQSAPSPVACTYQTCGLRIEPGWFGTSLVKGSTGERVAKLGGFGTGVDVLLTGPDSAAAHGRSYVQAARNASILGIAAVALYAIVAVRTDHFQGSSDDTDLALGLGSVGLFVATVPFALKSQKELSRSIWWYNASLPR